MTAVEEFMETLRPSKNGNWWRPYHGRTICVFRNRRGGWSWSIALSKDEVRYSSRRCPRREDAAADLLAELEHLEDV
jgi:hypothetical protein